MTSQPSPSPRTSSVAMEDYLEQILILTRTKGYARAIDIAERLNISQASVSNMLQRLDAEGLLEHEKYRGMRLTEQGEDVALGIMRRHELLTEFLELFGLEQEVIYHDVEGLEHHVSADTLRVFQVLTEELKSSPRLLSAIRQKLGKLEEPDSV